MLSIFPEFLNYQQIGIFILRITLAIILISLAYPKVFNPSINYKKITGLIQGIVGICLSVGFLTQVGALIVMIIIVADTIQARLKKESLNNRGLRFLIFAAAFALLFLGPGLFSIDLPL